MLLGRDLGTTMHGHRLHLDQRPPPGARPAAPRRGLESAAAEMGLQYYRGWPKIFRGAERLQFRNSEDEIIILRRKALEKVVLIRVDAKAPPEPTVKL